MTDGIDDAAWPKKTCVIKEGLVDSTRWEDVKFRDSDIVIDTFAKSGTNWIKQIVAQLIYERRRRPRRYGHGTLSRNDLDPARGAGARRGANRPALLWIPSAARCVAVQPESKIHLPRQRCA